MENQTLVSVEGDLITGTGKNETTLIHELSHHWWGDLVTPATWNHTWLSEGFGTYAEALYLEWTKGDSAYSAFMDRLMRSPAGSFKGSVTGRSDTAFWDSFGANTYFKGAIVLHMLRGIMGDSVFFRAMRAHLQDPATRYGNVTTAGFIRTCEKAYGKDLGWFFAQWVTASPPTVDRPTLKLSWSALPEGPSHVLTVTVEQLNAHELLYRLPFTITVSSGGADRVFPVVDSLARQTFRWTVAEKPDRVVLDKEHAVFFDLKQ
jgi:aminopeptidase N